MIIRNPLVQYRVSPRWIVVLFGAARLQLSAQTSNDEAFRLALSVGPSYRETGDYSKAKKPWGYRFGVALERYSGESSSLLVSVTANRFGDTLIVPTSLSRSPGQVASFSRVASSADWDPNGSHGHSDLSVIAASFEYRRFLLGGGRRGLHIGGGVGLSDLRAPNQHVVRPMLGASTGFLWQITDDFGVVAGARYDWLGIDLTAEDGRTKSPRWLASPITLGVSIGK
jgi:hypothetical protein